MKEPCLIGRDGVDVRFGRRQSMIRALPRRLAREVGYVARRMNRVTRNATMTCLWMLTAAVAQMPVHAKDDALSALMIVLVGSRPLTGGVPGDSSNPPPGGGGSGLEDWTPGSTLDGANLPQTKLTTTYNIAAQTGSVHRCDTLGEFTTALTNCARGDIIVLESGVTFDTSSSIAIPAKTGTGWIYVVAGDVYDDLFPKAPGERVTVSDVGDMATIRSTTTNTPALTFANGASKPTHWRFVGLNITATTDQQGPIVSIDGNTSTVANIPEWIGFDRCRMWGTPGTVNIRRGWAANGRSCYAVDSEFIGFRDVSDSDSQALSLVDGPGPFSFKNCRFQAASENFMAGGQASLRRPADIEFGYCLFDKDPAWEGVYPVKTIFELKYASRVYSYGCVYTGSWNSGQTGMAILIKSTAQTGDGDGSQYKSSDAIFNYCRAEQYDEPFRVTGATEDSTQSTDRVVFRHFAFVNPRGSVTKGYYLNLQTGALNGMVTRNCTIHTGHQYWNLDVTRDGPANGDAFTFIDNICVGGATPDWFYGPIGATGGLGGATALAAAFNTYSVTGNACRSTWTLSTISGNTASTATTFANIFTSYHTDLSIATSNWAEGVGSGGSDPGVDAATLADVLQYTVSGQRPEEL